MSAGVVTKRASLTQQAAALMSGSLAIQIAQVLLLVALTRLVVKPELGGYQQLGLIYGILSPFLVAGIPAALLYFIPRAQSPDAIRAWVARAYVTLAALGLFTSIAVVLGRVPLAEALNNRALTGALVAYSPYPFFAFVTAVMPTALVAVRRSGLAAVLNALSGLLTLVGVVGATLVEPNTTSMAIGLSCAWAVVAFVSTVTVIRVVGIDLRSPELLSGVRALLGYGVPLALTGLAGKLAFQFDRVVVSVHFTPAVYAVYVIGAVELPLSVIVQQSVNSVLIPALTVRHRSGDIEGLAELWRRAIRRTSLLLFPGFVFFMITAGATVKLLFGAAYGESVEIFRIYLLLTPIRVATYGLITQAIGRTRINMTASVILLAANAILAIALVGPLGLPGPAWATVCSSLLVAGYYLIRLRGILGISVSALFPWRSLATNLALAALGALPLAAVAVADVSGPVELVCGAAVYFPCYVGTLLLARALEPEERAHIQQLLSYVRPSRKRKAQVTRG